MSKVIIGIIMIIGGLSGKLVLVGTHSGTALAALGAALVVWGIVQLTRSKQLGGK